MDRPGRILIQLGLETGPPVPPIGRYAPVAVGGGVAYTSGVVALGAPDWALE